MSLVGLSAFTWRVFGSASLWRRFLVGLLLLSALATTMGTFVVATDGITENGVPPLYGRLGVSPQFAVIFAWMSVEALRYQSKMQRRLALGLADRVVTNRFGVWGVSSGISSALIAVLTYLMASNPNGLLGNDIASSAIVSASGLVSTFGWWLTFMPPKAYTTWI
jgi:hypothetical protein